VRIGAAIALVESERPEEKFVAVGGRHTLLHYRMRCRDYVLLAICIYWLKGC